MPKLSELIVKGLPLAPHQAVNKFFERLPDGSFSACALTTAAIGAAGSIQAVMECNMLISVQVWRGLGFGLDTPMESLKAVNPQHPDRGPQYLIGVIMRLNDNGWTREQIVAWLQSIGQ